VEFTLPPLPDCTPLDGAWIPLLDELLLDPFDELPDEPSDPLELEPDPDVEPLDELELDDLDDEVLPVLAAAWLDPGRIATTTPATATLARDTVTVVDFSRRRPCSRSATARATCRAASWFALLRPDDERRGSAACSSQLFTSISVTYPAGSAVGELSANLMSAGDRSSPLCGILRAPVRARSIPRLGQRAAARRAGDDRVGNGTGGVPSASVMEY